MSDIKNLWPKALIEENNLKLPLTILQEQANFLNKMTRNIVIAEIDTKTVQIQLKKDSSEVKPGILHTLKIVAPAIGNYNFELLRLIQEELLPYPLKIYVPLTEKRYEIDNSDELIHNLSEIFNDKKTISILQSLIMQSK